MWEYWNIKVVLLKAILKIGQKKIFLLKKLKSIVPWIYVIEDLNGEEIF